MTECMNRAKKAKLDVDDIISQKNIKLARRNIFRLKKAKLHRKGISNQRKEKLHKKEEKLKGLKPVKMPYTVKDIGRKRKERLC